MRDLRICLTQTRYALIAASRNGRVVVFGMVFPVVLLVLFASIFTGDANQMTHFSGGSIDTKAYFTAGLAAYAITLQTFSSLTIAVTTQRETGQLKRLRGTPMAPWTFIGAYVLRCVVLVAVMVVALFAIGAVAFGVHIQAGAVGALVVYVILGTAALATLGIAVTIFTPTAEAASTLGPFTAVILSFISGVFIPVQTLPGWLESVGKVFPLYHLADGLQRTVATGSSALSASDLAVLGVWGLGALVLAVREFRWVPQTARA